MTDPSSGAGPVVTPAGRRLGYCAIFFAAMVPVGEGVALAGFAALVIAALLACRRRGGATPSGQIMASSIFLRGMILVLGLALLASFVGPYGLGSASELGRWLPLALLAVVPAALARLDAGEGRRLLAAAGWAFIVALALACCFGLFQYWSNTRPLEALSRVDSAIASQGRVPGSYGRTAAGGFFFHRLKMAHVLLVGLALMVPRLVVGGERWPRRVAEALIVALFTATLLLTFTRAALLGCLGATVVVLLLALWRWFGLKASVRGTWGGRQTALGIAGGGLLALLVWWSTDTAVVWQRIISLVQQQASEMRGLIWSQAVRVIGDHPFGIGLGNYPQVIAGYYDTAEPAFNIRTYPHNVVLAVWAEAGPLGALLYLWALVRAFLAAVRGTRDPAPALSAADPLGATSNRRLAFSGVFLLSAFAVVGMTHDMLYHKNVGLAFFALLAVVLARLHPEDSSRAPGATPAANG